MFKTVKRIIDWCGEFKGRLYAGFVVSFFSHLFTALPIMLAAYTIGLLLQSAMDGTPFDTGWVWKSRKSLPPFWKFIIATPSRS